MIRRFFCWLGFHDWSTWAMSDSGITIEGEYCRVCGSKPPPVYH